METTAYPKPSKDKTHPFPELILLFLLLLFPYGKCSGSPHTVYHLTWQILSQTGNVVWKISGNHPLHTWWPDLTPDFCQLAAGLDTWDIAARGHDQLAHEMDPSSGGVGVAGCSHPWRRCILAGSEFYVCPRDGRNAATTHKCGGYEEYFCAQWGCETTGDAYWKPSSSWDKIQVSRGWERPPAAWWPRQGEGDCRSRRGMGKFNCSEALAGKCLPLNISFTEQGKQATDWQKGYTWGLRWYLTETDKGVIFKIQLKVETATQAIGPNQVLSDQKPPSLPKEPAPTKTDHPPPGTPTAGTYSPTTSVPGTGDRLLNLINGAYQALKHSDPDRTKACWLCLNPSPPYYEGIAFSGNFSNHTQPFESCRGTDHRLTLTQVSGSGLCIGNPPSTLSVCNTTLHVPAGNYYLAPPTGTYWACNTGLTPCVSAAVLNQTKDYCVLVQIWPRISYHSDEAVLQYYEQLPRRVKRKPESLTLAMILGIGGITAGIATGTSAMIRTDQFMLLHQAMNEDLRALEQSVRALKDSLTSLSEVVLQNRRGLDLLFLKEGGLCAALKEECCFYADQTGVVTETLDKLKERLDKKQREFESQQSWFEGIYNRSPWFTTLISSLMGPIILLMLILTFGPCILNRLTQFVKDRLSVIQTLVRTQQYQALRQQDTEIP